MYKRQCFLYPLYLGDAKIFVSFSEKEFLYYILTLLTALLYLFFPLQKGKTARKRLCRIDSILLLLAVLFIIKGSIRIILQEDNFETDIFFVCLIVTFFLLKSFSGNFVHYLNLVLFSSFLLYLDMLYYYLTERQMCIRDRAKSPAAMASINAAAGAVGGTVVATVNVELGKLAGGKFSLLAQGGAPITMAFGIPKNAVKPGYAYAMICVRPGGVIEVLPDLDADPNTVTFSTTGGLGAYAMIMYPVA